MRLLLAVSAAVLLGVPASAAGCPRVDPTHVGGTQGYADDLGSGQCYVSVGPASTPSSIYRRHIFFSDGRLLVFSSYGPGEDDAILTSAREFFFFPRSGALELAMDKRAGTVSVRMGDGGRVHFDPATSEIKSLDRGDVTVSPRVDPVDRGGVEITSYTGLVLDAGFRMGESPSGRPDATSAFRDAQGHTCTVTNRELFSYAGGEHRFKFTDAQLAVWLKKSCPALNSAALFR